MPLRTLASASAMAALLAASSPAAKAACAFDGKAEIPLESRDGALLVDARVAGEPVRLRLAFGAVATTLWTSTASRLKLQAARSGIAVNAGRADLSRVRTGSHVAVSQPSPLLMTDPVPFDLGSLHFTGMRLGVAEFQPARMAGADGLLGLDALSRYDVDLDVSHGKLSVYQPTGDCREPTAPLDGDFVSLPFTRRGVLNHQPRFDVAAGGKTFTASLSSVGGMAVISRSTAAALGLTGQGGAAPPGVVTIPELSVGGVLLRGVRAEVSDDEAADVTLRLAFMRKVRVWLSNSSEHLILGVPRG